MLDELSDENTRQVRRIIIKKINNSRMFSWSTNKFSEQKLKGMHGDQKWELLLQSYLSRVSPCPKRPALPLPQVKTSPASVKWIKNVETTNTCLLGRHATQRNATLKQVEWNSALYVWMTWIRDQDCHGHIQGKTEQPLRYLVRTEKGTLRRNRPALVVTTKDSMTEHYTDVLP